MNKQQIIAPLVVIGLAVLLVGIPAITTHHRDEVFAGASLVGRDLAAKTNSARLTSISPDMRSNLVVFLRAPAHSYSAQPEPDDKGHPTARVFLMNDAGEKFDVRLGWDKELSKFTVIDFNYSEAWTPTNPPPGTLK